MATGYTRQSAGQITNDSTIEASHFNNEYDQLELAFDTTTGHNHDGTAGGGAPIDLATATTGTLPIAQGGTGATTAALARDALGAASSAAATTSAAGIVQLSNSVSTTSSVLAATPTAVKTAYDLANGKLSSTAPVLTDYRLTAYNMGVGAGTLNIPTSIGNYFYKTISGVTTFTFTTGATTGTQAAGFILELTNGGAFTVNWPASVKWPNGTTPTLTAAGVDILAFITDDAGTTWRGVLSQKDSK